jgi:hypothetical protein
MAIDEGDNMRMMKVFQNIDFGGKVILQLLVELR